MLDTNYDKSEVKVVFIINGFHTFASNKKSSLFI